MAKGLLIKYVLDSKGITKLELTSPFSREMIEHCRRLGGHWNPAAKHWYFNESAYTDLQDACHAVYGTAADVELTREQVDISGDFDTALQYVSGVKALASRLDTEQRNQVLMALIEALS